MYKKVDLEIKVIDINGNEFNPVMTLADEYGGRCQISLDDKCYVLYLRQRDARYRSTPYIFPEALAALKTLPDPAELTREMIKEQANAE